MKFISTVCLPLCSLILSWIHSHWAFFSYHSTGIVLAKTANDFHKSKSKSHLSVLRAALGTHELYFLLESHGLQDTTFPWLSSLLPALLQSLHWLLLIFFTMKGWGVPGPRPLPLFSSLPKLTLKWVSVQLLTLNTSIHRKLPNIVSRMKIFTEL